MNKLYPWIILIAAALSVIFLGGKRRAFGLFVAQLHVEYSQTSLAELNWIGDSYAAVGYLTTGLTIQIILKTGSHFAFAQGLGALFILLSCLTSAYVPNPHWLFLTHTVFHGIGSSMILSTCGLIVTEYFDQNHPYHLLATTLVSGGSVASIVFVQLYAYLINNYGWRWSFIYLGIIYFVILLCGSFIFRKNADSDNLDKKKSANSNGLNIKFKQKCLLVSWIMDRMLTSIVTYGVLMNLADYMYSKHKSLNEGALLTTVFAAGEASTYLIGAILTAITRDVFKNRLKYILLVTSFLMTCFLVAWEVWVQNFTLNYIFAYLTGFCLGPSVTFLFPAGEEMTLLPAHYAYPFSLGGMGLGMSVSPIMSALIAQRFQYKWFFLIQGSLMALKFLCLVFSTCLLRHTSTTNEYKEIVEMPRPTDDCRHSSRSVRSEYRKKSIAFESDLTANDTNSNYDETDTLICRN